MPRTIRCSCGEKYKVTRRNAGTRQRCDECDRVVRFPDLDEDVEELEEVDDRRTADDDDEDYRRERNRGKPTTSKKHGVCYQCGEETKGKFHTFFVGTLENVDRQHDYATGETTIRTSYSNVHKAGVFLCKPCAVAAWKRRFLWRVVGFGIPFGFFAFLTLILLINPATRPGAVVVGIGALALGVAMAIPLYSLLSPSLERDTMERIAIHLAKGEMTANGEGDTYFTTAQFRETFGRHIEEQ